MCFLQLKVFLTRTQYNIFGLGWYIGYQCSVDSLKNQNGASHTRGPVQLALGIRIHDQVLAFYISAPVLF